MKNFVYILVLPSTFSYVNSLSSKLEQEHTKYEKIRILNIRTKI